MLERCRHEQSGEDPVRDKNDSCLVRSVGVGEGGKGESIMERDCWESREEVNGSIEWKRADCSRLVARTGE